MQFVVSVQVLDLIVALTMVSVKIKECVNTLGQ